jgi:RNA polymerase sigma-70 factor (ECF subfamily)
VADDRELLERWSGGDNGAARTLFQRYFDALYRFFRTKTDDGTEDLIQETFLACVTHRERFQAADSFRCYLFGVARNVLRMHFRKKRNADVPVDMGEMSVADVMQGPSTLLAQKAEHRLLLEGLRRLPVDQQIALELYLWEGMTARELGDVFGTGEEAARSRVRRARAQLQKILGELAASPTVLESTLSDLDGWARQLRAEIAEARDPA